MVTSGRAQNEESGRCPFTLMREQARTMGKRISNEMAQLTKNDIHSENNSDMVRIH